MAGSNMNETPDGGLHVRTMTIEAFARKYRLDEEEVNRLEDEFGAAAPELVLLKAARRNGLPEE
ncbi:hypothetical protein [Sinorhizobium mexicanum]|uniref:Uncharacterized protein n=1 Tax=Sinorhizobium mexicanum TaxID=375549 RepID=A0A859QQW0_9HYPH|nr:hypothetical protein [Sinorhizobium mexicanum]MBP1882984.1 hypothetical protein [Sinorhizobium mexicanum]QLL60881.1 hypothetical protein FKV68_05130 [Sinorhizobium mexicanum]